MFEKFKYQYLAILALPIIFWFIYNVGNASNSVLNNKEDLQRNIAEKYNEIVVEKGRMKFNRNLPYLKRKNSEKYNVDEIIWKKVDVGDRLIKISNSPYLKILKKDTVIIIDYNDIYRHWDSVYKTEY